MFRFCGKPLPLGAARFRAPRVSELLPVAPDLAARALAGGSVGREGLSLGRGNGGAEGHRAPAFTDIVAVPRRDLENDLALLHELHLAAEAAIQLQIGGHVEAVGLVVIHLGNEFLAGFYNDVTSGAGAVAPAGMLHLKTCVERDIEERFGLAVVVIRQRRKVELIAHVGWQERNLGHVFDYNSIADNIGLRLMGLPSFSL